MPVQINITGGDAAEAVKELVTLQSFMSASSKAPDASTPAPSAQPQQPATQQSYGQPQQPQWQAPQSGAPLQQGYNQQPPGQQQQQPQQGYGQQPAPGAGAVPTSTPTYTLDQLGVASQPVVDAGRGSELIAWLQQHGAQALTQLSPQHYGEFATYLRSLGAKI